MAAKFEIGKTYTTRSVCDYDCIFEYTVVNRTKKFITVIDKFNHQKRVGVKVYDNVEVAFPSGTYSMAPVISAG